MSSSPFSALRSMKPPTTAAETAELVHCCRWMSNAIPSLARRIVPLGRVLKQAYKKAGRITKNSGKNIALCGLSWETNELDAFKNLQDTLQNAVKLSYPKSNFMLCVFKDASDLDRFGVLTQTYP